MIESQSTNSLPGVQPLPYQLALRDYLKTEEPEVWEWFASSRSRSEQAEAVRFELLKSTYRIERETQPAMYEAAEAVSQRLGLEVPVTLYQAQQSNGNNASIAYLSDEAHVVLHGSVASNLTDAELRALLGHELSHLMLWRGWNGEFLIVDQVLAAMTIDPTVHSAHFASDRLFQLYNEVFCDRGSLHVADDSSTVISMLVKVTTGLENVSAESYLRQANEIFQLDSQAKTDELTHPEAYIRARAVSLWADQSADADAAIDRMIQGSPVLDELDLVGQRAVAQSTRRLIDALLDHKWMRTEDVLSHARFYFEDYAPGNIGIESLAQEINTQDKSLHDYYCFVLLDFVTTDRDLDELPLAAALMLSEQIGVKRRFIEIAQRELRLRKRQLEKIDQEKERIIKKAV